MHTLHLSSASTLQLPMPLAQQLAGLGYQRGLIAEPGRHSSDLLAGMRVKSQQSAAALYDEPDLGFHYQRALQQLSSLGPQGILSSADICELHRQLNPSGGHLRRVKLKKTAPYGDSEYLQMVIGTKNIEPALEQLLTTLEQALRTGLEPLVAIPLFSLDFMRIFPFLDGNRRIAVLLTRYLLGCHGHPVVHYVDLESEVRATDKAFYQSLYHCNQPDQPPFKWLAVWWVVLMRVYKRFDRQVQQAAISPGRGAKTALIEHFIAQQKQPFLSSDISTAFPTIGPDMIRVVLRKLRDRGVIQASGRGRGTTWSAIR